MVRSLAILGGITLASGLVAAVWAGQRLEYPRPCPDVCAPNIQGFGYFPTTWRQWPGGAPPEQANPRSIGAEVLPTPVPTPVDRPQGPEQLPLPRATPPQPPVAVPEREQAPPRRGVTIPPEQPLLPEPAPDMAPEKPAKPAPEGGLPGLPGLTPEPKPEIPAKLPESKLPEPLARPEPTPQPTPSPMKKPADIDVSTKPKDAAMPSPGRYQSVPQMSWSSDWEPSIKRPESAARRYDVPRYSAAPAVATEPRANDLPRSEHHASLIVETHETQAPRVEPAAYAAVEQAAPAAAPAVEQAGPASAAAVEQAAPAAYAAVEQAAPAAVADTVAVPPVAMSGYCVVELAGNGRWVPGDLRWTVVHEGHIYRLSGPSQRQRFLANPDAFAPVNSGNDPVLSVDEGRVAEGQPAYCATYNGRLYMFSSAGTQAKFNQSPQRYAAGR
jgi:YHS domain-containing protein